MISQLGRYEIVGELGQGAMGVVYKAKDPLIDRVVAIKSISLRLALEEKEEYEARFYQEAKAAGRLSHHNIVTIYDVGKSGDVAYIAMEFLQGRELREVLNEEPLLPVDQVLDIVVQVAQGLAYAHENGIVHRDVKPSNIMVVRDGHVKITDFGIARMASSAVRTQTGMVLGSPKYMSPEQVMGKPIDHRSDIFSLGVMLYEMLTGQVPFNGENVNAIMYRILNTVPTPPSILNPAVPDMLNFIVAKALAKTPNDRYRDAGELADDLRACRDTVPRSAARIDLRRSRLRQPDAHLSYPIHMIRRGEGGAEETKPVATIGLSSVFDSTAATMRLATMTSSPEEVEELVRTLKRAKPTADALNQAALTIVKPKAAERTIPVQARRSEADATHGKSSNLPLIAILALVLIGLVLAFLI